MTDLQQPQVAFAALPVLSTQLFRRFNATPLSRNLPRRHKISVRRRAVVCIALDDSRRATALEDSRRATAHDIATGRDPYRVKFFDTTLRDGEQSAGVSLNEEEKVAIARQLAKLGVDIIEAGFPIASNGDFEAVRSIARNVGNRDDPPIICGLARAVKKDIDRCWEAVKFAAFPRIHTFIATSDVHMKHKLKKTREEVLQLTKEMVTHACSLCNDVEFSAEDATRSDPDFLYQVFSTAIKAGATTINVPDTVGYTTPEEFGALVRSVRENVKGAENVTISVHGHDDLGMAVANFLAAVENGARQVECTINGIGERAGNASLEEVAMALHVRKSYYNPRIGRPTSALTTNINHEQIYHTSRMVSNLTGMPVQPNKAIVGANAFVHESGIHQDGVLKNPLTYEIMDAKSIGLERNQLRLGKHSGRHAFRSRLEELGYELTDIELNRAFARFKELADKKKEVSQADLESIVNDEVRSASRYAIKLERVQVQCGDNCIPTATVSLYMATEEQDDEPITATATGTGPVDAAYMAVNKLVKDVVHVTLEEYAVNSVTKGIDALGEVTVRVMDEASKRRYTGASSDTDIVVASTQAYVNAINRCSIASNTPKPIHPQLSGVD